MAAQPPAVDSAGPPLPTWDRDAPCPAAATGLALPLAVLFVSG